MIASLPMYWRAETAAMWRRFWAEVRSAGAREGLDLPDLTPPDGIPQPWTDHWLRDDLALSMTCGLPFRTALNQRVTYVGTLDFGLDTPPGHYRSTVVAARPVAAGGPPPDDLRLAYNSADSQSGWAVSQQAAPFLAPPLFGALLETGGHAASLAAVAGGKADIAYLDAVTWAMLEASDPNARRVHIVGQTAPTPGLPLITALGHDPAPLRRALTAALAGFTATEPPGPGTPTGMTILNAQSYAAMPVPKPPAL